MQKLILTGSACYSHTFYIRAYLTHLNMCKAQHAKKHIMKRLWKYILYW